MATLPPPRSSSSPRVRRRAPPPSHATAAGALHLPTTRSPPRRSTSRPRDRRRRARPPLVAGPSLAPPCRWASAPPACIHASCTHFHPRPAAAHSRLDTLPHSRAGSTLPAPTFIYNSFYSSGTW